MRLNNLKPFLLRNQQKLMWVGVLVLILFLLTTIISVTFFNNNNKTTQASEFTVTSIEPSSGPVSGGTNVTINGTDFTSNSNGALDTSFNVGSGANGPIYTASKQNDDKIIIGGVFTSYNGTSINSIARINTNGSLDTSFDVGSGANNDIWSTTIQSNGKVIIGGSFTSYNGTNINRVARLNTDGSLDTSFNVGSGASGDIYAIAVQSDGKIIIGGWFTSYNGTNISRLARLNADGSLDTSFNVGSGVDDDVVRIAIQSDGKIVIVGWFTVYNGSSSNGIVRVDTDGSRDTSFNVGSGANDHIYGVAIQSDGKIVVGGDFTSYNGTSINRIARLNTNGSLDTTFNVGSGANNYIYGVAIQSDGKIVVGGDFTSYNGTSINRIARLNTNGSLDTTFNVGSGANNYIYTTTIQDNGQIIINGDFTSYNGTSINRIARLNTNGSLDTSFNVGSGANGIIEMPVIQNDGKIVIVGWFTEYNGTSINRIARLEVGEISVTISGSPCTNVVLVSSTQLTCTTPSGTTGDKDVVVTNGDGQARTLTEGFEYFETTPLQNSNINFLYCDTPKKIGQTTDCTLFVDTDFQFYTGSVEVKIANQSPTTCQVPASQNFMVCSGLSLPSQIGSYESQFKVSGESNWQNGNIVNIIPNIKTEGLNLYYDAGHSGSYSGSGQNILDLSAELNHGFLGQNSLIEDSDPTWIDDTYKSLRFDGVNDMIDTTLHSNFSDNLSIEVWFRRANNDNITQTEVGQRLVTTYQLDTGANNCGFGDLNQGYWSYGGNACTTRHALGIEGKTIQAKTYSDASSTLSNSQFIPNNLWQHATLTYNSATGENKIYVNSVLHSTFTQTSMTPSDGVIKIGTYLDQTNNFTGDISIVRIYNNVLSLSDIQANYDADKIRFGFNQSTVTVSNVPPSTIFNTVDVSQSSATVSATLTDITFVDRRENFVSWTAGISITDLTNGSDIIAANNISIDPTISLQTIITGSGINNYNGPSGYFTGANASRTLFENLGINGGGEFRISPRITVDIPPYSRAGAYTGVITVSIS